MMFRFLMALLAMQFCFSHAGTVSWQGGAAGAWTDGSNWSTGMVPGPSDDVQFETLFGIDVTVAGTQSIASLSINGGMITLNGAATLNISGEIQISISVSQDGSLILTGGLVLNSGNTTLAESDGSYASVSVNNATWSVADLRIASPAAGRDALGIVEILNGSVISDDIFLGNATSYGQLYIEPGAMLTLNPNQSIEVAPGYLENRGTLQLSGSGTIDAGSEGIVNLAGTTTVDELETSSTGFTVIENSVSTLSSTSLENIKLQGSTSSLTTPNLTRGDRFIFQSGTLEITGTDAISGLGLQFGDYFVDPPGIVLDGDFTSFTLDNLKTLKVTNNLYLGPGGAFVLENANLEVGSLLMNGGVLLANSLGNSGFDADLTQGFNGNGYVIGPLSGTAGTTITAGDGPLVLGDLSSSSGFDFGGTLEVGSQQVVLMDADKALLGTATTLGDGGSLVSVNGCELGNGNALTATGNAEIQGIFTNNGTVNGPTGSGEALSFDDDVNGPGAYTGNVTFEQGFSPGSSPGVVTFGSLNLAPASTLNIELGGNNLGEYDQLQVSGDLQLSGTLAVAEINGFSLGPSAAFVIASVDGAVTGTFTGLPEGAIVGSFSGRNLFITYTGGDGNDVELYSLIPVELMTFTVE